MSQSIHSFQLTIQCPILVNSINQIMNEDPRWPTLDSKKGSLDERHRQIHWTMGAFPSPT